MLQPLCGSCSSKFAETSQWGEVGWSGNHQVLGKKIWICVGGDVLPCKIDNADGTMGSADGMRDRRRGYDHRSGQTQEDSGPPEGQFSSAWREARQ